MEFRIRQATDDDVVGLAPHYAAFLEEVLAEDTTVERNPEVRPERVVADLVRRERGVVLVAEAGGALVGFAYVEIRGSNARAKGFGARLRDLFAPRRAVLPVILSDRGWLGHLYVLPAHRRQGVASALVRAAADWARERGAKSLELNVLVSNEPARRLYEKLGMTATLVDYRLTL